MKRLLAFVVFLVLGIILFSSVVRAVGWNEVWSAIQEFWGGKGVLLLILTFLILALGNWRWKEILKSQGYHIPFFSLFKVYLGGLSVAFFIPTLPFGSDLLRAYTIQKTYNIPFSRVFVSALIERILEITAYLVVILGGVTIFLLSTQIFHTMILILFGAALLFVTILSFFYFKSFKKESIVGMILPSIKKTSNILEVESEVFNFFKLRNSALWRGFLFSFLKSLSALLRAWVLVFFLWETIGFLSILSVLGFSYLALLVPIPAALGSHDALQALLFQSLGAGAHTGAAFALLIRAAEFAFALVGILFLIWLGIVLFRDTAVKKRERLPF